MFKFRCCQLILGLIFFTNFITNNKIYSQLQVTTGGTPQQLVQNILVGGGVTVTNVTYTGSPNAIGAFTNGASTNLGLNSGIILSSGDAADAAGDVNITPSSDLGLGSDPQLQNLITQTIYDATVLQFDFVPIADTLRFRYVFGSDEYPEYVNSYNDVFGFFITGQNPLGGAYSNLNIALIPGTTMPVSINNVNNVNPSYPQYYVDNEALGGTTITYDGFTTVLTAWIVVVPCTQYHIKIAIGDAGDHILDSGVFLEANSFSSNAVSFTTTYSSNIDTNAIEGCNNAIVKFQLPNVTSTQHVIHYTIAGTAINGTDYQSIADSVIIPAGQNSTTLTINPISDGIAESLETIFLVFQANPCGNDTVKISIKDYIPLTASVMSPVVCGPVLSTSPVGPFNLSVNSANGFAPVSYMWSNGETNSAIIVTDTSSNVYTVTISDACGTSISDSVKVDILKTNESYTDVLCYGTSDGTATVTVTDGTQPFTYLWNTSPQQNTSTASNLPTGSYTVTITDNKGCTYEVPFIIEQPSQINLNITTQNETCLNSCNGQAEATVTGGVLPYSYAWSVTPQQSTQIVTNICSGNYNVTITDSNNCNINASFSINTNTVVTADFYSSVVSGLIPLNVDFTYTGTGASTWNWDFGDGATSDLANPSHTYTEMGFNNVTLNVNSGAPDYCTNTYSILIEAILPSVVNIPNVFTPNGDNINDKFIIDGEGLKTVDMKVYNRWGKLITEWSDISAGWDGKINGKAEASEGVYYYIFYGVGYDKKEYNLTGTVSLVR